MEFGLSGSETLKQITLNTFVSYLSIDNLTTFELFFELISSDTDEYYS